MNEKNKKPITNPFLMLDFELKNLEANGYELTIPNTLSINKIGKQYVTDKKNNSFLIANEVEEKYYDKIEKEDTVMITLLITKK